MEDKLEKFVRNHAADFNSEALPDGMWDAIEPFVPVKKKGGIRRMWPVVRNIAAAVLIFAAAWMLHDAVDQRKGVSAGSANQSPALTELSDAEAFYTSQINARQAELTRYARQHPEIIEDLKQEFREMDLKNEEFKKDLAESNADEKVIEAIILSYRVKLQILDEMLSEMKRSQQPGSGKATETDL